MSLVEFEELLVDNSDFLKPFAINLTRDNEAAKDLYQETLYKALANQEKYNAGTNIKAWLFTIMRNIFINNYRRAAKQKTVFGSDFLSVDVDGEEGEVDIKDDIKKLNIAPFVGVEYMLENGLFFDARYSLGVSNLSNDNSGGKVTNSFAQIGVGFKFGGN